MANTFQDFAPKGRHVVDCWLAMAGVCPADANGVKVNTNRRVVCAGGDHKVLMHSIAT